MVRKIQPTINGIAYINFINEGAANKEMINERASIPALADKSMSYSLCRLRL